MESHTIGVKSLVGLTFLCLRRQPWMIAQQVARTGKESRSKPVPRQSFDNCFDVYVHVKHLKQCWNFLVSAVNSTRYQSILP